MPTIVGILTFMNRTNLLLNLVEHEKRFITSNRKRHHFEKLITIIFAFKIEFIIYIQKYHQGNHSLYAEYCLCFLASAYFYTIFI